MKFIVIIFLIIIGNVTLAQEFELASSWSAKSGLIRPNIYLMGGGGGMGGTGYTPPTDFSTMYSGNFYISQLIKSGKLTIIGGNVAALGGGGGMGGTGRTADFIIRDGQLVDVRNAFEKIDGGNIIFQVRDDALEDIELASGEIVQMQDIKDTILFDNVAIDATLAVPINQIRSVSFKNGEWIEQSELLKKVPFTRISVSR